MRLALVQLNPTIGDLDANAASIAGWTARAAEAGADLVVFPELALTGYPPRDLLLHESFIRATADQVGRLGRAVDGRVAVVVGAPMVRADGPASALTNSLVVLRGGGVAARYDKRLLPTYDVFDEDRYFVPGDAPVIVEVGGMRVGLSVCEDLWRGQDVGFAERYLRCADPVAELVAPPGGGAGADLIVNPSASPFVLGKGARHRGLLSGLAQRHHVHVAGVNQVGGNDELVFDGHAAVYDPSGTLVRAGPGFEEAMVVCDLPARGGAVPDPLGACGPEELLFRALVLGVRDYCRKTGFSSVVLGLSGGIDSAVVAVLAAAAMGPEHVLALSMPSRYSSPGSRDDAFALADALGIRCVSVPIEGPQRAFEGALAELFAGRGPDVTEENLQSRIRGTVLMAASNKFGNLLLTTGNKSELAVGYCTLYGDMNGGLAVISDVSKQQVYRLAEWINANPGRLGDRLRPAGPPIPRASITKPPSAELRPDQTDQDTLPPYAVLDEILERIVERRQAPARVAAETGFDAAVVRRVARMIDLAEFKRRQAPIGLKVTGVAFGSGRRMPVAQRWRAP